jgi:hypothetical protein
MYVTIGRQPLVDNGERLDDRDFAFRIRVAGKCIDPTIKGHRIRVGKNSAQPCNPLKLVLRQCIMLSRSPMHLMQCSVSVGNGPHYFWYCIPYRFTAAKSCLDPVERAHICP